MKDGKKNKRKIQYSNRLRRANCREKKERERERERERRYKREKRERERAVNERL